jgi:glycosyltransferase involved in cell wall biosynthesis
MKIAVWHNLPSGGGKRSLYDHIQGLLAKGHTVESWCPSTADRTYLPLSEIITEHVLPLNWKSRSNRTSFNRLLNRYHTGVDKIAAMDEHCKQCADDINAGDFDLLFVNPCTFFRITSIGHYVKIPKVLYLQEPFRLLYEAMPRLPWLAIEDSSKPWWQSRSYTNTFIENLIDVQALRVQARQELKNAQAFDLILANSLFSRESIQRAYGLDSTVCYLGINVNLFEPLYLPRENMVVGLGAIYASKGIDRSVRAIGAIKASMRPSLVWIGNFVDPNYLAEVEKLALSLEVNFVPKVSISDREIVTLLNQASVMIYTPILEPFGFAPLEANSCGTPVVAIAEGGVRETIQHGINGLLVNGNEPVQLGGAISSFLNNKELIDEMGENARQHVLEVWSLEKAVERLEKCLMSLINVNYH